MFTGIIEEIGSIKKIKHYGATNSMSIEISAYTVTNNVQLGDSIAVNGVCLTITKLELDSFWTDIIPETFNSTSLSTCQTSSLVNLERSLITNGRINGHIVNGHIDTIGVITEIIVKDNASYFTIKINNLDLLKFAIYKGSIAIDGTSLTIFGINNNTITISLIPHTMKNSVIGYKKVGDIVNIEFDMFAKYITHILQNTQLNLNKTQ